MTWLGHGVATAMFWAWHSFPAMPDALAACKLHTLTLPQ